MRAKLAAAIAVISSIVLTGAASAATPPRACPRVEIRAAPSEQSLVAPGGVAAADVGSVEGRAVLKLTLTQSAAEQVRAYTSAYVGHSVTMLVDGKVFMSAKVRDPISGRGVEMGPVDPQAASLLAERINGCAKP